MHKGLPFSKPKVRLIGNPGEAQAYLGAAYNLLFQVRAFCEASGTPVFGMSRAMEDGAVVTAAVVGDQHIVSCTPPNTTRTELIEGLSSERGFLVWKPEGFVLTPRNRGNPHGWGLPRTEETGPLGTPGGSLREVIINKKRGNGYPSVLGRNPEGLLQPQPSLVAETEGKFAPIPKQLSRLMHFGFMEWRSAETFLKAPRFKGAVDGVIRQFDTARLEMFWEKDTEGWFVHRPVFTPYAEGSIAAYLLDLINTERTDVPPAVPPVLGWGTQVAGLGYEENSRMSEVSLIGHNSPLFREGYRTVQERANRVGIPKRVVGENLIYLANPPDTPEEIAAEMHAQWMGSPNHAANVTFDHRGPYLFPESVYHFLRRQPESEENKAAYATVAELKTSSGLSAEVFVGMPSWIAAGSAWWTGDEGTVSWNAPVNRHFVYATSFLNGSRQYENYPNPAAETTNDHYTDLFISGRHIRLGFRPGHEYLLGAALSRETVTLRLNEEDEQDTTIENALILRVASTNRVWVRIHDFLFQDVFRPVGTIESPFDSAPVEYGVYPKSFRTVTVCTGNYAGFQRVNFSKSGRKAAVTVYPYFNLPTDGFFPDSPAGVKPLGRTYRVAGVAHYILDGTVVTEHAAPTTLTRDSSEQNGVWYYNWVLGSYVAFVDFSYDDAETVLEAAVEYELLDPQGSSTVGYLTFPDATRVPLLNTTFAYIDIRDSSKTVRLEQKRVYNYYPVPPFSRNDVGFIVTKLYRGDAVLHSRAVVEAYVFSTDESGNKTYSYSGDVTRSNLSVSQHTNPWMTHNASANNTTTRFAWDLPSLRATSLVQTFSPLSYFKDLYGAHGAVKLAATHSVNLMPCPPDSPIGYVDWAMSSNAYTDFCANFGPAILGFNREQANTYWRSGYLVPTAWDARFDVEVEYAEYKGEYILSVRLGMFGEGTAGVEHALQDEGVSPGDVVRIIGEVRDGFPNFDEDVVMGGVEPVRILRSSLNLAEILGIEDVDDVIPLGVM